MRNSREAAAENRQKIVAAAARLFRAGGIEAVSVGDVMKKAGMTHGGFYRHFESKDALVAEACRHALAASRARMRGAGENAKKGEELKAIVDGYLSEHHRANPGSGCALAALGGELARTDNAARTALAEGRAEFAALVARYWPGPEREANASALVSALVGALVNARIAGEDGGEVLRAARRALHRRIAEARRAH
jgi:TetR/AcrR family transcriptional repressor of nem operon